MRRVSLLLLTSTAVLWFTLIDRRNGSSATSHTITTRALSMIPLKPTIYTFQEHLPSPDQIHEELRLWQLSWKQAGWDARVITFTDALNHPNFDTFERALGEIMPFGRRPEKMGYYRFLAMSVVGGGFLADVDVLPIWQLSVNQRETILKDDFAVRCGSTNIAPCLMSGSGEEWNRISIELLSSIQRHHHNLYENRNPHATTDEADIPLWTNIYALQDVVGFGNSHGRPMAQRKRQVLSARQAYDMRKFNKISQQQCNEVKDKLAVQFSATVVEDVEGTLDAATNWLDQWKRDCLRAAKSIPLLPENPLSKQTIIDPRNPLEKASTPLDEAVAAAIPREHVARLLVRNK